MKITFSRFSTSLRIAILVTLQVPFCLAQYSFTRLYTPAAGMKDIAIGGTNVAINNAGMVAFEAMTGNPQSPSRTLMLAAGPGNFIKLPLPENIYYLRVTSVNSSGVVAFVAELYDKTVGVYTSSATGLVQVAVSRNYPVTIPLEYKYANPTINDRGDVAFLSSSFGWPSKIMLKSGGQLKVLADLGNAVPLLGNVNAAGSVAYSNVQTGFYRPAEYTIYSQSEGSRTLIAKSTKGRYKGVALNDQGTVVFGQDTSTAGSSPVFASSGGSVRPLVDSPSIYVFDHVSVNNAGTILMRMDQTNQSFSGLTTGPAIAKDKVIALSDPLFGSTLKYIYANESDDVGNVINDRGQIAFRYELASGEAGIAIANPPAVGGGQITNGNSATLAVDQPLAQDSIATALGSKLATFTVVPEGGPASTLGGSSVTVTDSAGVSRAAPLFFVSPGQINYLIPAGTATGPATIKIVSGDGTVSTGGLTIVAVAPGIYSLNAGKLTAASVLRVHNGAQSYESVYQVSGSAAVPLPIDLGPASDQVYLLLYGTGLRHAAKASVLIGGATIPVLFSGASSGYPGLDQINIGPLPRTLVGTGAADVVAMLDTVFANLTSLTFK